MDHDAYVAALRAELLGLEQRGHPRADQVRAELDRATGRTASLAEQPPAAEDALDATPQETAVPKRRPAKKAAT